MHALTSSPVDLLIIGGGINGVGIAADAAGRGLSVVLCEQNDLASATSSASSKLIHGGLRYLEQYEFRLVREALREREVLLRKAPHLVHPLRFVLPHSPQLRPAWMLRSGLFLYDHLSKRDSLPGSRGLRFDASSPLQDHLKRGFEYSDCWVDDARLVIANALAAAEQGARILTRQRCTQARRRADGPLWDVTLVDQLTQHKQTLQARALVNAAGPWVTRVFEQTLTEPSPHRVRLVQGSHIIVRRFHDHPGAFILQNHDRRIVFVLPYQDDFHLIGTTDREFHGDPAQVQITGEEIEYLLNVVNSHFKAQLHTADVVSHFSGVRPLRDDEASDPSAITRDYSVELNHPPGQAPLLAVFGGKITTYRKLAESALAKLAPYFPEAGAPWTETSPLPGADQATHDQAQLRERIKLDHPWLPGLMLDRFSRSYGLLCLQFLQGAARLEDLGQTFGAGLYAAEVDYLLAREWAKTAEDILWRRTKLGLYLSDLEQQALRDYLGDTDLVRDKRPA